MTAKMDCAIGNAVIKHEEDNAFNNYCNVSQLFYNFSQHLLLNVN